MIRMPCGRINDIFTKSHYYAFLVVFILSIRLGNAQSTFYKDSHFRGSQINVNIHPGKCFTFSPEWNDAISSVNTKGQCIIVYEHANCQGRSSRIAPGTPSHSYLADIGFNDVITSAGACSGGSTTSGKNSQGQGNSNNEVWRAAVEEHNKYRRRHGSPDLIGDPSLHGGAQKFAEHLANRDLLQHSGAHGVGENLAANQIRDKVGAVRFAVKQWYDEHTKYDYNHPGFSLQTGHFTAVVWRNTKRIGIGIAWNPKKRWWVIVANYSPPGNFDGQYGENVRMPS